ncbi:MAG: helix-turn-helix domain-containing protein, partial [Lachnospiraceae bacterium]
MSCRETVSERLREAIEDHGITQKRFSEISGLPHRTIQEILKGGNPRAETIVDICKALGVSA